MVRSVFQRPARTLLLLGAPARRSPGAGVGDLGPDPEDEAREWRIADRVAKSPTSGASHRIASQPPLSDVDRGEGEDEFGKKAYYHQVPIYGGSGAPEHLHHQTTNNTSFEHYFTNTSRQRDVGASTGSRHPRFKSLRFEFLSQPALLPCRGLASGGTSPRRRGPSGWRSCRCARRSSSSQRDGTARPPLSKATFSWPWCRAQVTATDVVRHEKFLML